MKNLKKLKLVVLAFVLSLVLIPIIGAAEKADNSPVPGSASDPIITLSYITEVLKPQITAEILASMSGMDLSALIDGLKGTGENTISAPETNSPNTNSDDNQNNQNSPDYDAMSIEHTADSYKVIELKMGQKIKPISGSIELIVRQGSTAVALTPFKDQGIGNLTTGKELLNDEKIPTNHSLLIPRADGRSVCVLSDVAYIMVRGEYEIVD